MLSAARVGSDGLGKGCDGTRWRARHGHMKISKTTTQCGSCRWHIVATWSTVHHQNHQHHPPIVVVVAAHFLYLRPLSLSFGHRQRICYSSGGSSGIVSTRVVFCILYCLFSGAPPNLVLAA